MLNFRNSIAVEACDWLNSKFAVGALAPPRIAFYAGPRPAFPESVLIGTTMLCSINLPDLPFLPATSVAGAGTASADLDNIPEGTNAATGTASFFLCFNKAGLAILVGDVSNMAGNGECKIMDTTFIQGRKTKIGSWTVTYPQ
jgi:hypothetical protein